jgi:hypothetical protein
MPEPDFQDEAADLAELVDDAAKALSIGGSLQSANEVRQAVDSLKHQFGGDGAPD